MAVEIRRRDYDVVTASIADAELVAQSIAANAIVLCGDGPVVNDLAVALRRQLQPRKVFIIGVVPDEHTGEAIDARAKGPDQVLALLEIRRELT